LFTWLLGKDTLTGTGDPYTHTITRDSTNGRKWLTIRRKLDTNFMHVLYDAKIESITIEMEAGKPVVLTVEGNALNSFKDTTEDTPSYETIKPFKFYHGEGNFDIESAANSDIKKATIKITVASQEGFQTDGIVLGDLPDLKLDGDITLEFFNNAMAFFQKSVYNNQTSPQEDIYSGAFDFDLLFQENVADDREFKLAIPKFFWQPVTGTNLKGEPEAQSVTLAGPMAKPAAGEIITVTMKNSISTDLG